VPFQQDFLSLLKSDFSTKLAAFVDSLRQFQMTETESRSRIAWLLTLLPSRSFMLFYSATAVACGTIELTHGGNGW
jgi:hypothetical protein